MRGQRIEFSRTTLAAGRVPKERHSVRANAMERYRAMVNAVQREKAHAMER
jgi:hypothetical protein